MSRRTPGRGGATMVEVMVAGGLFLAVMAGAWMVFSTSRRQAVQVLEYSDILQAATSVATRLQLDLSAAWVPPGGDIDSSAFDLGAIGARAGCHHHRIGCQHHHRVRARLDVEPNAFRDLFGDSEDRDH